MFFKFGEKIAGYDFEVINERQARASAGIMFLVGIISTLYLFGAFGGHSMLFIEFFSITFVVEFVIRAINPKYAPYMILGSMIVYNQKPEWVEAKPKQFAWLLGLILAIIMAYYIIFDILSPIRLLTCVLCLVLFYLEAVFGICLGCIMYKKMNFKLKGLCPGGVCDTPIAMSFDAKRAISLIVCFIVFALAYYIVSNRYANVNNTHNISTSNSHNSNGDCIVPQYVINMGHEDMWKKHHGCSN